jgi:hypothetical protein
MLEPTKAASRQAANRVVRVSIPADVAGNLDRFHKVQKDILGKLGCLGCCSGWDIRWDQFTDFQVDAKGAIRAGQGF